MGTRTEYELRARHREGDALTVLERGPLYWVRRCYQMQERQNVYVELVRVVDECRVYRGGARRRRRA